MDFYYLPLSAPCRSVLMTAKSLGIELNKKLLDLQAGEHLKHAFLKINPQHTIPTLVDGDFILWESRGILRYWPIDPEMYKKTEIAFDFLNTFLEGKPYAAGDSLTVADLALLATVRTFEIAGFDYDKYAKVARWYANAKTVAPGSDENWEGTLDFKKLFN